MKTANELLYDATLRHQIKLLRYSEGQARSVAKLLDDADAQLVKLLQTELTETTEARLKALLVDIRKQRAALAQSIGEEIKKDSEELASNEAEWEIEAIKSSVPVELKLNAVAPATLKALAGRPMNGIPLEGWLDSMQAGDVSRIEQQLRLGIAQGETLDQMVTRIRGTKANDYKDGVTSITRRNAQTIARTTANHVSNQARQATWEANADIIKGVRWVATLDGRTSDVCRGRDGQVYPIDSGPRPPGHPGCRSTTTVILGGEQIVGDRPFVRDTRTRAAREVDFRKQAQEKAGDSWKGMTKDQRNDAVKAERQKWTDENIGQVPSTQNYDSWMRGQPKEFQDEVLGKAKADIFRKGTTLDKFVDAKGKPYTIDQLKEATSQDKLNVVQPGVGMKAKALLQQGKTPTEVLDAIKLEYPDASTSAASIASYKSELKKAGALDQLVGKVPTTGVKQALAVSDVVKNMEANLPAGLKHAIGGQWANVVEDLDGVPGAYGYYEAGKGVQLSGKKLSAIHPMQAQQVAAHELGHMLHKQHDVQFSSDLMGSMNDGKGFLSTEAKKLYGYYLSSNDELVAEIYAQALSPSVLTSQGLSAIEFNDVFKFEIGQAKAMFLDKFPVPSAKTPPPPIGAPTEVFEVAGAHKTVGGLAKALLQQGMPDDAVLAAVKAQFPDAKTGKASLASYKTDLKKAGLLPAKGSGPTVVAKAVPDVAPAPPSPAMQEKVLEQAAKGVQLPQPKLYGMTLSTDMEDVLENIVSQFQDALKAGKGKLVSPLDDKILAAGVNQLAQDYLGVSAAKAAELVELANYKVMEAAAQKAAKATKKATTTAKAAAPTVPPPKLAGANLGSVSSQLLTKLKTYIAGGGTDVEKMHTMLGSVFGSTYKKEAGLDLIELAKYEVATGKQAAKPYLSAGTQAAGKVPPTVGKIPQPGDPEYPAWIQAKLAEKESQAAAQQALKEEEILKSIDMAPKRAAATPRQGVPPPPRFTAQQQRAALLMYNVRNQAHKLKMANAAQKAAGLPELTGEEITAIWGYTTDLYKVLNTPLRSGGYATNLKLQAYVEAAQLGLSKMPKFKGLTSRGMTIAPGQLDKVLAAYRPGMLVEESAFISTSAGSKAAFGGNIIIRIQSKTGVDVSAYSRYPGEREVLYMPGTRHRVLSVEKMGDKHIITMEEV